MKKITDSFHLKKIHLDLLSDLLKVLDANKIEYFLYYGSLLGAVRHKGFIPWDDDIDLAMTRVNYEKFKNIKIDETHLKVSAPGINGNHPYFFAKFYSTKYICLEDMDYQLKGLGINIDVFPIDYIPKSRCVRYFQEIIISTLIFLLNAKVILPSESRGLAKNISHIIFKNILSPIKVGFLAQLLDSVSNYRIKTGAMGCRASIYRKREYFESEVFETKIEEKFQHLKCSIPKEFDTLLKGIYGNYMVFPNPSDRTSNHTTIIYSR